MERDIIKRFKLRGLSIKKDALDALLSALSNEEDKGSSLDLIIDKLIENTSKASIQQSSSSSSRSISVGSSNLISLDVVEKVVADLTASEDDMVHEALKIIDAFDTPKLFYDEKNRTYKIIDNYKYTKHAAPEVRAAMYRQRLLLTQQRLLRSGKYKIKGIKSKVSSHGGSDVPGGDQSHDNGGCLEVSTIESLLGSTGTKVLFGMLVNPEEGSWFLEDLSSIIRLDLTKVQTGNDDVLYTVGCQVIVLGQLRQGANVFVAEGMGFPHMESRNETLNAMNITDNLDSLQRPQKLEQLQQLEEESVSSMFVILSDVQLDRVGVPEKLQRVFDGFEGVQAAMDEPILFILLGSFVTKSVRAAGGRESIQISFSLLGDLICACPNISTRSKFVIVPGPEDPGLGEALPRSPIPPDFTSDLRKRVKNVHFTSNPSRLKFYTQEIVIFRENLLKKMQRHCITPPGQEGDGSPEITEKLVMSLLDQAHLCPLPLEVKPLFWDLDHSMRLTPLPHLLILGDRTEKFVHSYNGCVVTNPGSFSADSSFIVYRPAERVVELSQLD